MARTRCVGWARHGSIFFSEVSQDLRSVLHGRADELRDAAWHQDAIIVWHPSNVYGRVQACQPLAGKGSMRFSAGVRDVREAISGNPRRDQAGVNASSWGGGDGAWPSACPGSAPEPIRPENAPPWCCSGWRASGLPRSPDASRKFSCGPCEECSTGSCDPFSPIPAPKGRSAICGKTPSGCAADAARVDPSVLGSPPVQPLDFARASAKASGRDSPGVDRL